MVVREGVRAFQKHMTTYINGEDIVVIEDAKTHINKGVYMPYKLYTLFQEQFEAAIREDVRASFTDDFDGSGLVNEH